MSTMTTPYDVFFTIYNGMDKPLPNGTVNPTSGTLVGQLPSSVLVELSSNSIHISAGKVRPSVHGIHHRLRILP